GGRAGRGGWRRAARGRAVSAPVGSGADRWRHLPAHADGQLASGAAAAAYRAWGYRRIGEARPWGADADLHGVMLLDLRRTRPPNP
ncbi:hypothetical protein FNH09_41475, partial [Streptomyces adustus]|nr:hypothetical protein [Streptomyces adustus]